MVDLTRYNALKVEFEDSILTMTINNAAQRNAMTPEIHADFDHIFRDIADDEDIRCVIITAAGDSAFSAGGNLRGMIEHMDSHPKNWRGSFVRSKRILEDILLVEQPIICAMNGDAYGLGCSIALMSDIIVANERAKFADTHVKVGLVAGDGGTLTWPLAMSVYKAKEHLMRGTPLLASEAAQLGIINYALPYEEVMPKAREIALELASGAPWAIRWTKAAINKVTRERLNLLQDTALATEWLTFMTDDHSEAAHAFFERRPSKFVGH